MYWTNHKAPPSVSRGWADNRAERVTRWLPFTAAEDRIFSRAPGHGTRHIRPAGVSGRSGICVEAAQLIVSEWVANKRT